MEPLAGHPIGSGQWGCRSSWGRDEMRGDAVRSPTRRIWQAPKSRVAAGGGARTVGLSSSVSVAVAGVALATGYALARRPIWTGVIAVAALLWLLLQSRGSAKLGELGLIAGVSAAGIGVLFDVGAGWMLVGLVATLTAWDLAAFSVWLQDCPTADEARALVRVHLQRLLVADALGLALALVALQLRVRPRLGILLLLGLVLAVGLSQLVRYLRRQTE
jgi:hypothetical protein